MSIIFDLMNFLYFTSVFFGGEFKYRSLWWYAETLLFAEVVRAVKVLKL